MTLWGSTFWKAACERAAKTAAQAAILATGADTLEANAFVIDWANVAGFGLGGAALSFLFSIASSGVGNSGPSLAGEELPPEH